MTKLQWIELKWKILDTLDIVPGFFRRLFNTLERVRYWGWNMRNNYDFGAQYIYEMLYHKLDRTYRYMRDNGHCVWNESENSNLMRKLREARELAYRIWKDEEDIKAFEETDERYGFKMWTTPEGNGSHRLHITWERNPEEARKFRERRTRHYESIRKYYRERFYYLMSKYLERWWD